MKRRLSDMAIVFLFLLTTAEIALFFRAGGWSGYVECYSPHHLYSAHTAEFGISLYAARRVSPMEVHWTSNSRAKENFSWFVLLWPTLSFDESAGDWSISVDLPWCWIGLTIPLTHIWFWIAARHRLAESARSENEDASSTSSPSPALSYAARKPTSGRWFWLIAHTHDQISGLVGAIVLGLGLPIAINAFRHSFWDDRIAGAELSVLGGLVCMCVLLFKPVVRRWT